MWRRIASNIIIVVIEYRLENMAELKRRIEIKYIKLKWNCIKNEEGTYTI